MFLCAVTEKTGNLSACRRTGTYGVEKYYTRGTELIKADIYEATGELFQKMLLRLQKKLLHTLKNSTSWTVMVPLLHWQKPTKPEL